MAPEAAVPGTEVTIHVVGVERSARVIGNSPYDPQGRMMRS
jgi:dimethylglycine dehydrogenase